MKILEKIIKKQEKLTDNPTVTIAVFGDSVTQGCFECYLDEKDDIQTVFDAESSYGNRLKEMLNLLYPSVPFQLINAGISGDSAKGGVKRIERDVLSFHPDLVVVGFALNDSTAGLSGLAEYKQNLTEIVQKVKAQGAECIVLTPNAMNTSVSPFLKEKTMIKLADRFAKIQSDGVLDRYAETAREVARENGALLCDVYAKWQAMIQAGVNVTDLLANKLNHPIRKMHYMTAMMLLDLIIR